MNNSITPRISAATTLSLDIIRWYSEYAPFISRIIQRLVGEGPQVDDLLQETFIVAFKKQAAFNGRSSPKTWLYAIASRLCLKYKRSSRRFRLFSARLSLEPASKPPTPPDQLLERDRCIILVHELLEKLPFKQREAFILYELEKLEGEEIAEILQIPIGTVWTRLHHARKKFTELARRRLPQGRIS
jgi:RNA polymerase sigma-70 factor (ECF subfamily)